MSLDHIKSAIKDKMSYAASIKGQMPSPRQSVESDPEITLHLIKLPMAEKIADHHCVLVAA